MVPELVERSLLGKIFRDMKSSTDQSKISERLHAKLKISLAHCLFGSQGPQYLYAYKPGSNPSIPIAL